MGVGILERKWWGLTNYCIEGKPCSKKEYIAFVREWEIMDPFKRRAQIFAREFKLDDSKFFVNTLETTMRSVHQEVTGEMAEKKIDILKRGLKDIDPIYPIDSTSDRSCQSCEEILPDDGTIFKHKPNCAFLKAVRLL